MPAASHRWPVLRELARSTPPAYAVQVEQALALAAGDDAYVYGELAYACMSRVRANGERIARDIPASQVHERPWRDLCVGLEVIADETAERQRAADFRALLAQNVDSVRSVTTSGESVVCRKCRSTQVAVVLRQTRSADEGMSGFATCRSCGSRWKLN